MNEHGISVGKVVTYGPGYRDLISHRNRRSPIHQTLHIFSGTHSDIYLPIRLEQGHHGRDMNVTILLVMLRLRMRGSFILHVFVECSLLYFSPFSAEKALEVSRL